MKFADGIIDVAAFPGNIWLADNVVVLIPLRDIDNVPDAALETFNAVIPVPEPTEIEVDKVLDVLFHAGCKIDVAAFPINIWVADNVVVPISPGDTDNVPHVYLMPLMLSYQYQKPTKLVADKVLDVIFHVKFADCIIDVAAFPGNTWLADNVIVLIPLRDIDNEPDVIFDEFNVD